MATATLQMDDAPAPVAPAVDKPWRPSINPWIVAMTVTLMLSFVPAITETLTRLPISNPIAASQDAPVVKMSNGILLLVFLLLLAFQLIKLRKTKGA